MTDDPRPDGLPAGSDADALASAYLDGEATAAERATVEGDPALLARVEAFRRVAARVGTPPPPPPATVSQPMLAAALDAAADPGDQGAAVPPPPPAVQLAARRRRRMPLPVPAVAAAIVVLLLVGLGLLFTARGDDAADDVASGGNAATESRSDAATPEPGDTDVDNAEQGAEGPAASSEAAAVTALGDFPDEAALRALLARVDPATLEGNGDASSPSTTSPPADRDLPAPTSGEVDRCDDAVRAQVEQFQGRTLADRTAVAAADLAGRPVLVYSHPVTDDPGVAAQLTVADIGTCQILAVVQR